MIDTGVSPHPRLGSRLRGGGDYLTGGSGLADCDGHGTAVAGIIAASAVGRADGGVEGIAPAAQVLAIRQSSPSFEVAGPDGTARAAGDVRTLAEAIVLAVRSGATVINISEAVCLRARQAATQGAQVQAALRLAARSDVVVVAAAGNVGVGSCAPAGQEPADQVALPGWYGDDILTVGAVGPDDAPAAFTVPGPWVDVAAPGSGLRSLAVGGGTTGDDLDGTSFAAPWVAGLAALLRERFPRLTAAQVVDRIVATARRPAGGRSALQVGRGVVDPLAALTAVPDVLPPDPPRAASAPLAGTTARPEPPARQPRRAPGGRRGDRGLSCRRAQPLAAPASRLATAALTFDRHSPVALSTHSAIRHRGTSDRSAGRSVDRAGRVGQIQGSARRQQPQRRLRGGLGGGDAECRRGRLVRHPVADARAGHQPQRSGSRGPAGAGGAHRAARPDGDGVHLPARPVGLRERDRCDARGQLAGRGRTTRRPRGGRGSRSST